MTDQPTPPAVRSFRLYRSVPVDAPLDLQDAPREEPLRPLHPEMVTATMEAIRDDAANADLPTTLVLDATANGASDIHLDPTGDGCVVRFRINGVLYDAAEFLADSTQRLVNQIKGAAEIDPTRSFTPQEGRWRLEIDERPIDLRVTTIPSVAGDKIAIRLLDPQRANQQLDSIGLSEADLSQLNHWADNPDGLLLTVGPTGSGKTTTLYALLQRFRTSARSIVTVEDPVEYRLEGLTQVQVNERQGLTFPAAIRSMLRLDPNIVMVGEVRDNASATAAAEAAITGRVVMSSLHCRDAAGAVTALRNRGVSNHQIAASLRVVVAQRLVRRLDPDARIEVQPDEADLHWLKVMGKPAPSVCYDTPAHAGRHALTGEGRIGVYELLELTEPEIELILADASEREIRNALVARGHDTLVDDGLAKVEAGLISLADLRQAVGVSRATSAMSDDVPAPGNPAPGMSGDEPGLALA
ncbi:MAG: ATPase, T2SS/T4P/T4SS family [Planctomycetota bacterium]